MTRDDAKAWTMIDSWPFWWARRITKYTIAAPPWRNETKWTCLVSLLYFYCIVSLRQFCLARQVCWLFDFVFAKRHATHYVYILFLYTLTPTDWLTLSWMEKCGLIWDLR
jgi:hypothetical protein